MNTLTSDTLQLSERHFAMVQEILQQVPIEYEVLAYGSRARGEAHPASDLDLIVRNVQDWTKSFEGIGSLWSDFEESNLPIRVDVFDWSRVPESFRPEILRSHVVIRPAGDGVSSA